MNHQVECAAVAQPNGGKVTHVARREAADAKRLRERHHRTIHQAEAEISEASVHFHRT